MNIITILLKVKTQLNGIASGFSPLNGELQKRIAQTKEYNKTIRNGDVALRNMLAAGAAYFSGGAMSGYAAKAREAEQAQQGLVLALRRTNQEAQATSLIELSKTLEAVTRYSKREIQELEAQLVSAGLNAAQVMQVTESILDHAAVSGKGPREAVTDFLNTLVGGQEIIRRWGLEVGETGDRVQDVLIAWQKGFGGASKAALVSPEEKKLLTDYENTTEQLGNTVRVVALPFLQEMLKVMQAISNFAERNASSLRSLSAQLGEFARWASPIVIGYGLVVGVTKAWMLVINPLRAAVFFFTKKTLGDLIKQLWTTASASKAVTSGFWILSAAISGITLGLFINELDYAGAKVKDWVAATLAELIAWGAEAVIPFKIAGLYITRTLELAVAGWKRVIWGFISWYAARINNSWMGQKLGIEIDTTEMDQSLSAAKETLEKGYSGLREEAEKYRKDAKNDAAFWRDSADLFIAEGKDRESGKSTAKNDPQSTAGTAGSAAAGRTFVDLQAQSIQKLRDRYALETQLLQLELAGNKEEADGIRRKIREQDALNQLGKGSEDLIKTRLDLEDQEIAKQRKLEGMATRRTTAENTLTRLQTERQIAQDRGDQKAVDTILEQERDVLEKLIVQYKALAEAATTAAEKSEALAHVAELEQQLATLGQRTTIIDSLRKKLKDLGDSTQHLIGGKQGIMGGLMGWVADLGTAADQVASTIKNTIGSAVSGITDGIMGWVDGTKSWGQAMSDMGNAILRQMLQTIINMGVQWLVNTLLIKTGMVSINQLESQQRTQRVAEENAATAEVLPGKLADATASGIGSFGVALAFGALALAMVLGAMSAFDVGGMTPPGDKDKPVGIVHADEWVAPKWMRNHPVWGGIIMNLEGVRQRGFSLGGWTTSAPALDPAFALATNLPSQQQSSAAPAQESEMLSLLKQIAGKDSRTNVAVLDSNTAVKRWAASSSGQTTIVDTDRKRRSMMRARA